tara:strand:+ start:622 stop:786 length:165 start_codon:yes stop_codon:yes gene_type:complete
LTKITKTQAKKLLDGMQSKALKLFTSVKGVQGVISVADYTAIEKICNKARNRLK